MDQCTSIPLARRAELIVTGIRGSRCVWPIFVNGYVARREEYKDIAHLHAPPFLYG